MESLSKGLHCNQVCSAICATFYSKSSFDITKSRWFYRQKIIHRALWFRRFDLKANSIFRISKKLNVLFLRMKWNKTEYNGIRRKSRSLKLTFPSRFSMTYDSIVITMSDFHKISFDISKFLRIWMKKSHSFLIFVPNGLRNFFPCELLTIWDSPCSLLPSQYRPKVRKWTIDFYILMIWQKFSAQVPALNMITIVTSDKINGTTVSFLK